MTSRPEPGAARPPLPREYGAWAMLALPLLLGSIAGGRLTVASGIVVPSAVLLFLARFAAIPGGTSVRGGGKRGRLLDGRRLAWMTIYLGASAAGLALALLLAGPEERRPAMAFAVGAGILGFANAVLVLSGRGRAAGTELLAMASAAAMAPLVAVLAGETRLDRAAGAGAACLAYSVSTLVFVRTLRGAGPEGPGRVETFACLAVHLAILAALVQSARSGWLPVGLALTFVAPLLRTVWGLARPTRNLRVVGWREVGVSIAVLVLGGLGLAGS